MRDWSNIVAMSDEELVKRLREKRSKLSRETDSELKMLQFERDIRKDLREEIYKKWTFRAFVLSVIATCAIMIATGINVYISKRLWDVTKKSLNHSAIQSNNLTQQSKILANQFAAAFRPYVIFSKPTTATVNNNNKPELVTQVKFNNIGQVPARNVDRTVRLTIGDKVRGQDTKRFNFLPPETDVFPWVKGIPKEEYEKYGALLYLRVDYSDANNEEQYFTEAEYIFNKEAEQFDWKSSNGK